MSPWSVSPWSLLSPRPLVLTSSIPPPSPASYCIMKSSVALLITAPPRPAKPGEKLRPQNTSPANRRTDSIRRGKTDQHTRCAMWRHGGTGGNQFPISEIVTQVMYLYFHSCPSYVPKETNPVHAGTYFISTVISAFRYVLRQIANCKLEYTEYHRSAKIDNC